MTTAGDGGAEVIDLPELIPLDGDLGPDGDHDAVEAVDRDLGGRRADRMRLTRSRLSGCDLDGLQLRDGLLAECVLALVTAGALDVAGTRWRDVLLQQVRIGSLQASDGDMTRVTVRNSRLDFANLRSARLTDVRFERCVIADLDLGAATALRVTFADCRIERLDCFQADLDEVDISTSQVDEVGDVSQLRGVTISPVQLAAMAPAMAAHLGVEVRDEG